VAPAIAVAALPGQTRRRATASSELAEQQRCAARRHFAMRPLDFTHWRDFVVHRRLIT
jgi:hypothetical protein